MLDINQRSPKIVLFPSGSQWLIKETDPSSGNTALMLMPVGGTSREEWG